MDGLKLKEKILLFLHQKPIELGLLSLSTIVLLASLALFVGSMPSDQATPITIVNAKTDGGRGGKELYIDVSGAVKDPGIYVVEEGARLYEVIQKAGGVSDGADVLYVQRSINQSKKLKDEEKIYIPFTTVETTSTVATESLAIPTKILINSATTTLLESLPGIGKVTADSIVSHRPYSSIEELVEKKVVTTKVFEQIKDLIEL